MLFSLVKDPEISTNDLNHDLDSIRQWADQWKLEFNPDPTKQATEVLFSCKISTPYPPQLTFNGTVVAKMKEQKHLGLTLNSGLSFEKHLNEKIIKAKKNLGIIKHLSRFLPLNTLDQMYKTLVRSHLDYCDIIYHIPSKHNQFGEILNTLMERVEKIQYHAALAITGAWQGSNRSKLYDELGWESLSDRRWRRRVLQIHNIVTSAPCYLGNKLPRFRRPLYSQNNANIFHGIRCKTDRYMNSFFPNGTNSWNNVISHFKNIPSVDVLKNTFFLLFAQKKKVFSVYMILQDFETFSS